jgi:hypothetical protein
MSRRNVIYSHHSSDMQRTTWPFLRLLVLPVIVALACATIFKARRDLISSDIPPMADLTSLTAPGLARRERTMSRWIVIYCRYSSDMQRTESCDDQERDVRAGLARKGIDVSNVLVQRGAGGRVYGWAKKNRVPLLHCPANQRPHELVEETCPVIPQKPGVFCIVVKRAPYPVWSVRRFGQGGIDLYRAQHRPFVNHFAFHVWDVAWGHLVFKMCGHPPFTVQILVNGHEYVVCLAKKRRLKFRKEDNCFTDFANAAGLRKVADTLRSSDAIGRLQRACVHWLYQVCLCLALDVAEQEKSGFCYEFSIYQGEYSRNLLFAEGRTLDKVFQGVIDRTRAALDVRTIPESASAWPPDATGRPAHPLSLAKQG